MKLIYTIILFLTAWASSLFGAKTLDFYFIDTELGNAVLVVTPSGQAMMLDTGQPGDEFVDRVMKVIRMAGVKQLDYVIVSHYHWDHFGTIPGIAKQIPILNYVDHGRDVNVNASKEYYERYGGGPRDKLFEDYAKTRDSGGGKHIVPKPGDHIAMKDIDVQILTCAGHLLLEPLPGAGALNPGCALTSPRTEDTSEDGQSISKLVTFGKFRYVDFGDLTWNKEYRLFCPRNMVGTADVYVITHHGISQDMKAAGMWEWGRASAPPAEIRGIHPRVAVLLSREDYVGRVSTPEAWRDTRSSPGLEDIWQIHYEAQGGKRNNAPDQFIANLSTVDCQAHYIKLSAEMDGSFTMTNSRNGFTKRYPARATEVKK
jgi:beta-lactamase superfamily II metal-dependent hydrolase